MPQFEQTKKGCSHNNIMLPNKKKLKYAPLYNERSTFERILYNISINWITFALSQTSTLEGPFSSPKAN